MKPSIRLLLGFAILGFAGEMRSAESLLYNAVAPGTATPAGGAVAVPVLVLNETTRDAAVTIPLQLEGTLFAAGRSWAVSLEAIDASGPVHLSAGGFVRRGYCLVVPTQAASGTAILDLRTPSAAPVRVALEIAAGTTHATESSDATTRPPMNLVRAQPAAAALIRTFADRLAPHEPTYFIYGANDPAGKFQFSFKYKVIDLSDVGTGSGMTRSLQFAYTQRSLWDLNRVSSPFYDTSYMPEIMFESLAPAAHGGDRLFSWLGAQTGFRHESNGRDGPLSRSLNVVYIRPAAALGRLDAWHLLVVPEIFTYVGGLGDNDTVKDYRGYGRLLVVFGRNDGPSITASVWGGRDFDHGTMQLDLTVPIRTKLWNFESYLLLQYFNGRGESFRAYSERSELVRAGISLVR